MKELNIERIFNEMILEVNHCENLLDLHALLNSVKKEENKNKS